MTIRRMNVQTGEIETLNEDAPSFPRPAKTPAEQSAETDALFEQLNGGALGLLVDLIFKQSKTPQPTKQAMLQALRADITGNK